MSWAAEQAAALDELAEAFGAEAEWLPFSGGSPLNHAVLFESATRDFHLDAHGDGFHLSIPDADFVVTYPNDAFAGLKASVDAGHYEELSISVDGKPHGMYAVRQVKAVGDGSIYQAKLSAAQA